MLRYRCTIKLSLKFLIELIVNYNNNNYYYKLQIL